jgi:hypothetical protein
MRSAAYGRISRVDFERAGIYVRFEATAIAALTTFRGLQAQG